MSHAAEGELHAWLDGALDQLGEERARELREHMRACARCQGALAEEEGLRAHANEILALSTPAPSDLLPLELLLERARGGAEPVVAVARPRRLSHRARLGWAASVMVALGAGWMAREMGIRRVAGVAEPVAPVARTVAPIAPSLADAVATESAAGPAGPTVEVASAPAPTAPAAGTTGSAQGSGAGASGVVASAGEAREESRRDVLAGADRMASVDALAAEKSAAPPAASFEVETLADAGALGLNEIVVTGTAAPAAPPPALSRPAEAPASRAGSAAGNAAPRRNEAPVRQERAASASAVAADPAAGIGIQRARPGAAPNVPELFVEDRSTRPATATWEADLDEARDLIVPSLTLLKVEWNELSPGRPSLRALHELESGETLEVRWIRSGGAAADAASDPLAELRTTVPDGWSQVIRVHRDGWLVGRAPIALDALEALMKTAGTTR